MQHKSESPVQLISFQRLVKQFYKKNIINNYGRKGQFSNSTDLRLFQCKRSPSADIGFPRGGRQPVSQKLHENVENWTKKGGAHPKNYYVDPPLVTADISGGEVLRQLRL